MNKLDWNAMKVDFFFSNNEIGGNERNEPFQIDDVEKKNKENIEKWACGQLELVLYYTMME